MQQFPLPLEKDDSEFGLCALSHLTEKGDDMDMDSNINTHTHTHTHTQSVKGAAVSMTNLGLE